jgi:hypothetical protein
LDTELSRVQHLTLEESGYPPAYYLPLKWVEVEESGRVRVPQILREEISPPRL